MELKGYFNILRRRKWVIIVAAVATSVTAFLSSAGEEKGYQATLTMAMPVQTGPASLVAVGQGSTPDPQVVIQTQILRVRSRFLASKVVRRLQLDMSADEVLAKVDAEVHPAAASALEIRIRDTDPRRAAAIANAYAELLVDFDRKHGQQQVRLAISRLDVKLKQYEQQILALGPRAARDRRARLTNSYTTLARQRDQLSLMEMGGLPAPLETIEPAVVAPASGGTTPTQSGLVGLVVGLILGLGVASALEYADEKLRTKEDMERYLDAPVLASVDSGSTAARSSGTSLVVADEPSSRGAEAYRVLRTNLKFLADTNGGGPARSRALLVAGVNSSFNRGPLVLANLAIALSQAGRRVVVICSNLRDPGLHRYFEVERDSGLSDWLAREGDTPALVVRTRIPELCLVPPGPPPENPAELLASSAMRDLVSEMKRYFDYVLLDVAPITEASDAAVLAQGSDGVVMVASAGQVDRQAATEARDALRRVGASVLGVVTVGRIAARNNGATPAPSRQRNGGAEA